MKASLSSALQHKKATHLFWGVMCFALLLRVYLAAVSDGFLTDISCFASWALRVYRGGFADFYSPEVFTDYPPGYIYLLYPIGALLHHTGISAFSAAGLILLKLPSLLCDMAAGALICFIGIKKGSSHTALLVSVLYLLNPAVLLNSVIWGQVDSILVLLVLLLCLLMMEAKVVPACYVFAAGLLLKPQMLIFAPVLLYGIYEHEFCPFSGWKKFGKDALGGFSALLCFFLALLPFGIEKVIPQYTDTLASYTYASVNAYNIWALFGLNWKSQEGLFLGISYQQYGSFSIVLLTLLSAILFEVLRREKREDRYVLTGAFIMITTFMFSVRMHERYLYPAMLLLTFAYLFSGQRGFLLSYGLISLAHFLNVWHVLYYYDPYNYQAQASNVILLSGVMTVCVLGFYTILILSLKGKLKEQTNLSFHLRMPAHLRKPAAPTPARRDIPFTRVDLLLMAAITLLYGAVAFMNLGYQKAPKTEYTFQAEKMILLEFPADRTPATLCCYLRTQPKVSYKLQTSPDGKEWTAAQSVELKNVFSWSQTLLPSNSVYLALTNTAQDALLGELIFLDQDGQVVTPLNHVNYSALFDEADTLPETFDYRASSYFDEIYYFRTANEFLTGQTAYEMTHPPLGKILISLGALLFGTNPLGFRFMGTLFGVLMLPILYLFARNLTGHRGISTFATVWFAFDFMHYTQSRVATIDSFLVFFILLMYFFMERYLTLSNQNAPLKKTFLPLGACGIAFGLGVACKWSALYAGAGLALLFFISLYKRYWKHGFDNTIKKTIGFCLIFFLAVPGFIYVLSYIPFRDYTQDGLLTRMWNNQLAMYRYHSNLEATHAYSSVWYEWPTMVRPVFYYANKLEGDLRQGISSFGNPAVWYAAIPATLYTLYLAVFRQKREAAFLSVGFLAQLLPWVFITRCTFLYHYFPSVPFLVLMLGYCTVELKKRMSPILFYSLCGLYTLAILGLFALFYPVITGTPVALEYVKTFLRWLDSWVLVLS